LFFESKHTIFFNSTDFETHFSFANKESLPFSFESNRTSFEGDLKSFLILKR
jgi:hypothetical protein